jgi:YD repeat-containing protein
MKLSSACKSLLTVAILLTSLPASAVTYWTGCPAWSTAFSLYLGSPELAASEEFQNDTNYPPSTKPIAVLGCTPGANDLTVRNCTGRLQQPYFGSLTAFISASGSGWPVAGNDIVKQTDANGVTQCAVNRFDFDPFKNRGDPSPSPKCDAGGRNCQGNPINVGTGNKFQREVDIPSTGEGTLEFVRYYNSATPFFSNLISLQWSHTYSRSLFKRSATEMHAYRADGRRLLFTLSNGIWSSDPDVPDQLVQVGTTWQLTTADDEVETYNASGQLLSIRSRSGKIVTLTYSDDTGVPPGGALFEGTTRMLPAGLLIRVTDFRGRSVQFTYGTNGNISKVTDAAGQVYQYSYGTGNLGTLNSVQYPGGAIRTYLYNESAHTSGANLPYTLTGITDENGARYATYKYNSSRKAISTEHAGGVNKYQFTFNSGQTVTIDPLGTTLTSPTSNIANTMQVTGKTRSCTGCGAATTETFTFDTARNATSYKDFNGNPTCSTFQARNLETQRIEGLSGSGTCANPITTSATRTISREWHATWRLPKRIAEPLKITTFSYHGDTGVSCAPTGAPTTLVCTKTVQATTDADGSLSFNATADGAARVWSYTYTIDGQLLTVDGPRTDVTDSLAYSYYSSNDPGGNYKAGDLASITNAKGHVTQFVQYDANGRLLKSIDPNGLETILEYWPRGWLKTRKLGTAAAGYETTSFAYDNAGQLTRITSPDASYVEYTYDDAHRLWKISDGLGNRIEYTLDNMGNRVGEAAYDLNGTLVRAHTRVIDGLNRLFKDVGGTSAATQIVQNGFDANGNLTSILDPLGRTTTQEFDALNRLTAVKDPFNGTSAPTSFQYNRQGALTQVTDPNALSTTYTMNGHGEVTSQVSPDTGTTAFTHDPASNVLTKLDARGIQASFSYDQLNRVTQITYPDETVSYVWDSCTNGKGRACSITDRSGTTVFSYDLWGRVTSKSQTVASLTQSMSYSYNSSG